MAKKKKKILDSPAPRGPLAPYLVKFSRFDWAALLLGAVFLAGLIVMRRAGI